MGTAWRKAIMNQISTTKQTKEPSLATLQAAVLCFQEARYDAAIIQARALIRDYPQHVLGWKLLGASLQAQHQYEQALGVCRIGLGILLIA